LPGGATPTLCVRFDEGLPGDAPFLDGHFPRNPIVPGAVLLGYAANALSERGFEITTVMRVKFLRPLLPDEPFEIVVDGNADTASVVWREGESAIAQARVTLRALGD